MSIGQVKMDHAVDSRQLDCWIEDWQEWRPGYAVPTVNNGGSKLLIFAQRAAPSADGCCESHATACPRTTGRESNHYKALAASGVAFLARQEHLFNAST